MAILLNDSEIRKIIGSIIVNGSTDCIRPNSYIIRLGEQGEFLNTNKEFKIGKTKKGIKIQPGHSVAVTSLETLDFSRETVYKVFPEYDLHALLSPTTDLSREGLVAPTTQVDAGYSGTLNWTITNTSNEERRFIYGEKIFRLTIFKLEDGEKPEKLYEGDYQNLTGYIRSRRKGPPVGMKDSEWVDSTTKGSPEDLLDNLLKSGYPWHVLGQKLIVIDQQFKSVSDEYAIIHDSIDRLSSEVESMRKQNTDFTTNLSNIIKSALKDEATTFQNRWLLGSGSILIASIGLLLSLTSNSSALNFFMSNGPWLGLLICLIGIIVLIALTKKR